MTESVRECIFVAMMTIQELRDEHAKNEAALVRYVLEKNDWRLTKSAKILDVPAPTLRKMIRRHGLNDEYEILGHGQGRPAAAKKKSA